MKGIANSPDLPDNMLEVVFVWRFEDGWSLESVSDNVSIFGHEVEDFLIGDLFYEDLIHPADLANFRKKLREYSDNSEGDLIQEYRILMLDGDYRWVRENTHIIYDKDGCIQGLRTTIVDINDEKQHDDFMSIQDELGSDFNWPVYLEESTNILIELTTRLEAIDICALYVVDEVNKGLVLVNHKGLSTNFVNSFSYLDVNSIPVEIAKKGFPIYMHYSEIYPLLTDSSMEEEGLQGTAIIPIYHKHHFVGVLIVSSSSEFIIPEGDRDDLDLIKSLAGLMISTIEMAIMSDDMRYGVA